MTITITTQLHEGVGGEFRIEFEAPTTARNLIKLAAELPMIRKQNERNWGNVGCGRTWLEIDGREVETYELHGIDAELVADEMKQWRRERSKGDLTWKPLTLTERATALIKEKTFRPKPEQRGTAVTMALLRAA